MNKLLLCIVNSGLDNDVKFKQELGLGPRRIGRAVGLSSASMSSYVDAKSTYTQSHPVSFKFVAPQRLLRHISCIQIKNFTPFPARDDLTTALSQPSEQSQFTSFGTLSDDLDVTLSKKRPRKVSSHSVGTIEEHPIRTKENGESSNYERRGRKRTMSSGMSVGRTTSRSKSAEQFPTHPPTAPTSGPTVRPHRQRTTSMASFASGHFPFPFGSSSTSMAVWPDTSQAALENILQSRLVETFVTMTALPEESTSHESSGRRRRNIAGSPRSSSPGSRGSSPLRSVSPSQDGSPIKRQSTSHAGPSSPLSPTAVKSHRKTDSLGARSNGSAPFPSVSTEPRTPQKATFDTLSSAQRLSVPNYISNIHRPSTNPSFPLDPRSGSDVAKWTNLAARKVTIQVWGKVPDRLHPEGKGKGKWKDPADIVEASDGHWKVLEEWKVDLDELIPLSEEVRHTWYSSCETRHPNSLSQSSLLIRLSCLPTLLC